MRASRWGPARPRWRRCTGTAAEATPSTRSTIRGPSGMAMVRPAGRVPGPHPGAIESGAPTRSSGGPRRMSDMIDEAQARANTTDWLHARGLERMAGEMVLDEFEHGWLVWFDQPAAAGELPALGGLRLIVDKDDGAVHE